MEIVLLLAGAAALLAACGRSAAPGSTTFLAAVLGAGLVVSEAAILHPLCWVPSALLPSVLLVGPGAPRRRARLAAVAAAGIGTTVVATSAATMVAVYAEQREWGPRFGAMFRDGALAALVLVLPIGLAAFVARRLARSPARSSRERILVFACSNSAAFRPFRWTSPSKSRTMP